VALDGWKGDKPGRPSYASVPVGQVSDKERGGRLFFSRTIALALIGLNLAAFAGAASGPFEDGLAAYYQKDFATALRLFEPLVEQSDARAQLVLGFMYFAGEGVAESRKLSFVWFSIAGANSAVGSRTFEDAVGGRDMVAQEMSPAELNEARAAADLCQRRSYKDCE
jgi:hypothetical protein